MITIMRVIGATLFHIAIPCTPFETSFGAIRIRPALIVCLKADTGHIGYGEASLLYEPISEHEVIKDGLRILSQKLPRLIGRTVIDANDVVDILDKDFPVTTFAIEAAYTDLLAKQKGVSLATYFGANKLTVQAGESIGLQGGIEGMLEEMHRYVEAGITRIKIKIKPGNDRELLRVARMSYPALELGADANAAYRPIDLPLLESLEEFNLAFIEQPFAADDLESHRLLNESLPVCLDESILDEESCKRAIGLRACSMVNIKPARIGSYRVSKRIHDLCLADGMELFGGGRLETGVGKTMNAAFYALPGFSRASDITPPADYLQTDIASPAFEIAGGQYILPDDIGSGVTLDSEKLDEFLVDSVSFGS